MMMVVQKTEHKIKETTRSNNQGHEDYLHESRHLCSYVVTVLHRKKKLVVRDSIRRYI